MSKHLSIDVELDSARNQLGGHLPAAAEARIKEDRRLEEQFPQEYVAFVDRWHGSKLQRHVLAHGKQLHEIQADLDRKLVERPEDEPILIIRFIEGLREQLGKFGRQPRG